MNHKNLNSKFTFISLFFMVWRMIETLGKHDLQKVDCLFQQHHMGSVSGVPILVLSLQAGLDRKLSIESICNTLWDFPVAKLLSAIDSLTVDVKEQNPCSLKYSQRKESGKCNFFFCFPFSNNWTDSQFPQRFS